MWGIIPVRLRLHPPTGQLGTVLFPDRPSVEMRSRVDDVESTAVRRATTPRKAISPKYKPKKIKGSNVVPQAGWVLVKRQPHNMVSDCVARVVFHRTLGNEQQKK